MSVRLAALTIDVEPDYGKRLGDVYLTLEDRPRLDRLGDWLRGEGVSPTQFVVGSLLERRPDLAERLAVLGGEMELHSHTHPTGPHDVRREAERGSAAFKSFYGRRPQGYRSPYGHMTDAAYAGLASLGFRYSSSIFPTWRPWRGEDRTDHTPYPAKHAAGMWELPMAAMPAPGRPMLSMSYLRAFGPRVFDALFAAAGTPSVCVIDSHLHDFIPSPKLYDLPLVKQLRYRRYHDGGVELLAWLVGRLRTAGYEFVPVSAIVERLEQGDGGLMLYHTVRH